MEILPYNASHLPTVKRLQQQLFPHPLPWAAEKGWLAWIEHRPVGYAFLTAVEGLPQLGQFEVAVLPAWQRQGIGTALLAAVRQAAKSRFNSLTAAVSALESAGAAFLQSQGFEREHDEVLLGMDGHAERPRPHWPDGFQVVKRPPQASQLFCQLYEQSFRPQRWYQPYELDQLPPEMADTLFLQHHGRSVGFARLLLEDDGRGQIEPIGLIPAYQGQGLGRQLLLVACEELVAQGVSTLQIGVWVDNRPAVSLYQSIGFQPERYTYYFALTV